jgi:hypothetical protein
LLPRKFRIFGFLADCWIPKVDVSWEEQGARRHQLLTGPSDIFKIIDEAEVYAAEMAKAWIDVEFVTADPKDFVDSSLVQEVEA